MSIGENIRRLREREGLSQTAFAGRLGVTKETVGRWESGRTFPRRTHLDKMIADFAVCADDIMSEERGLGTAPSAPTADNWPGPETRNDGTGAAEGAGDAILPVYKTDRSGNGTTLRHTGYACAPSDVAARHVASIFVRMDYREMTRLYPVGSLLLVCLLYTSSSRASSQLIGSNCPDPLGPTRRSGSFRRSGLPSQ